MTVKDMVNYWKTSAEEDFAVAENLFKSKNFHYCLFFCHLSIEKLFKGIIYKKSGDSPPKIHNLIKLAKLANITISGKVAGQFAEMNTWNIKARYEDYKRAFYKKATYDFTKKWLLTGKELFLWLKKHY